ncbi:MAG TPA: DUF4476 domain-containing protein [Flavobacteriales bacterium]|nr:DUF4476 domain-containing protein [Flavobacteriales bacterium]
MARSFALSLSTLLAFASFAQTSDLIVFTDDGTKFTLVIDGDVKNNEPASRVVATGIKTETPVMMVKFADAGIAPIKQNGYLEMGKEYTMMVTTNKKGARVLRMTGQAELGTTAKAEPEKIKPTDFEDDGANSTMVVQEVGMPGDEVITTTTVVEEGDPSVDGENVNIDMGVNGINFNMSVKVDEGMGESKSTSTSTRTTTTTTTTTRTGTAQPIIDTKPKPVEPAVYNMPGYTGRVGCAWPMTDGEFADVKKSIEAKSFEDSKMTLAKQVGSSRCFTVDQVKGLMGLFSFEDSKLDIAKYAYERTYDIDNYYKVNDAFTFETSIDDLNGYIQAR